MSRYQPRVRSSGRFSYTGDFSRRCRVCGGTLGIHAAEAPHPREDASLVDPGEPFKSCPGFKPMRPLRAK